MKYLLMIFLATITSSVWADEGIDITKPVQVSKLNSLQEKLDSVSAAIMECLDSGEEHEVCTCKHKELILQFNTSVKSLFSNYPDFEKLDIVRFKTLDGTWVSQSLKGIRKQAGMEPSCT